MELSDVKRLTDELGKVFSKNAAAPGLVKNRDGISFGQYISHILFNDAARLTWLFACMASLSKRGLLPANLAGTDLEKAISRIAGDVFAVPSLYKDASPLAHCAGNLAMELAGATGSEALNEATESAIRCFKKWSAAAGKTAALRFSADAGNAFSDPLLPGWVYQYLLQKSEKDSKSAARAERLSPLYTQWFTPSWIADFLIEDAITSPRQTFIDPACGAGHILVPALRRSVTLLVESGLPEDKAVQLAINELIFGLDIEPQLTAAANLSLYLACRDIHPTAKLNPANLFSITNSVGGSLCLNVPELRVVAESADEQSPKMARNLPGQFDALAANPPYMSRRNMPDDLCEFLSDHYPLSKYDLYSAFVELSIRLLKEGARASLICQQSVLSISRFKPLREFIEQHSRIETIVQLGSGSFPTRAGEKVNNAIITFRRQKQHQEKENGQLQFARILYPEEKKQAEIFGIKSMLAVRDINSRPAQSTAKPTLAPWCPPFVLELFEKHPPLQMGDVVVVNGLFTCNNKMFVRKFDEVPEDARHEYVPYDKGGGQKWYHSTPYMLHWQKDGDVIREYRASRGQSRSLPGEDYYFKPGITYSYIGTQGFKARLLSPDCIFDIASSSVFTPEPLRMYMLGFMNSSLVRYLMGVLNPTINFQIGDLRRIPYAQPDQTTQFEVSKLAQEAVDLAQKAESLALQDADVDFLDWAKSMETIIQTEIDRQIFALYNVPSKLQKQILQDPWVVRGQKNVFSPRTRR